MEKLIADKVPQEMIDRPQWVVWKHIERGGKLTKTPFQPAGEPAKSNDPTTWSTFRQACHRLDAFEGIGYVFASDDEYCGIDLDGCRNPETGQFAPWARDWLKVLNSYSEISPSGTGAKIFVRAVNPRTSGKKIGVDASKCSDKEPGIEIYDRLRYFAVTGHRIKGLATTPQDRQKEVDDLCNQFWPERKAETRKVPQDGSDVIERARRYLVKVPPSISGSDGHGAAFRAACVLVLDFALSRGQSLGLLSEWNQSCRPPWSEKELEHKVDDAEKQPGERGRLRDTPQQQWSTVELPKRRTPDQPKTDGTTLASAAESYLTRLESGKGDLIELGIADLDYGLGGGVAAGEMVIIAARPSHGKSAVALQCLDTTSKSGMVGVMISEEMSKEAIGKRVIQYASEEAEEHWRHQIKSVRTDLCDHFSERAEVYVVEGCRTAEKAAASIRWYAKEKDAKVAVVDYAQILGTNKSSRYEEVTNTSITLRQVANETGIVVIVLCQLNRSIESREKFIPRSSDLRESGQLEQDADVVFFLVWPHRIDSSQDPATYHVYIAKNRNRAINQAVVEARFLPNRQMLVQPSIKEIPNYTDAFDAFNSQ